MKAINRKAIRLLPLLVITVACVMAGTGAKSAAEWPPASCKEQAMVHAQSWGKLHPECGKCAGEGRAPKSGDAEVPSKGQILDRIEP